MPTGTPERKKSLHCRSALPVRSISAISFSLPIIVPQESNETLSLTGSSVVRTYPEDLGARLSFPVQPLQKRLRRDNADDVLEPVASESSSSFDQPAPLVSRRPNRLRQPGPHGLVLDLEVVDRRAGSCLAAHASRYRIGWKFRDTAVWCRERHFWRRRRFCTAQFPRGRPFLSSGSRCRGSPGQEIASAASRRTGTFWPRGGRQKG